MAFNPNFVGDLFFVLIFASGFMGLLGVADIIAEYILPKIPAVKRYLDSLPDCKDEEDWQ